MNTYQYFAKGKFVSHQSTTRGKDAQDGSVRKTPVISEREYWVHGPLIFGIIFMRLSDRFR
jgi:hypothetical protein